MSLTLSARDLEFGLVDGRTEFHPAHVVNGPYPGELIKNHLYDDTVTLPVKERDGGITPRSSVVGLDGHKITVFGIRHGHRSVIVGCHLGGLAGYAIHKGIAEGPHGRNLRGIIRGCLAGAVHVDHVTVDDKHFPCRLGIVHRQLPGSVHEKIAL